ncbi:MAG TPA: threonine-phosphate decarboxylase [Candidatus Egerieimonas intestinavium]|uniref:threonine-phosphate decarboxylase n=1 Tax=Candidatus Egerieimonas intestinavium TaxID=2840777 RepID=A0A9D1EHG9_9FIRM|nr:threonine-phosphate decarboxylase [Candidatus Egerieimonas intestinavium]
MPEARDHFHGSDLEKIEAIYHIKKEDIVSFSANVNPLGISPRIRRELADHLDVISRYPDREYTALRCAMAVYAGTEPDHILVGNGATELISLFIQNLQPKKALILGPTYSEYERAITLAGGQTSCYPLQEEQNFQMDVRDLCSRLSEDLDLLVLCNPNNPTGTAVNRQSLREIFSVCKGLGITVLVDETYVEFTPQEAEISAVPLTGEFKNLIILRGTSKFFAAPGLRLGYAITGDTSLLTKAEGRKDPWGINSIAELAGQLMFSDTEYIRQTRQLIFGERTRLYEELSTWDSIKLYPTMGNYQLVRILKEGVTSRQVFEHCIRQGLMIRDCSNFPTLDDRYFRFCFMLPQDNDRLVQALREIL